MWESWLSGKGLRALSLLLIGSPDLAGSVSTLSPGTGLGPLSPEPGLNRGEEVADKGSFVHPGWAQILQLPTPLGLRIFLDQPSHVCVCWGVFIPQLPWETQILYWALSPVSRQ